jgi:type IV secretion system protein VirD4
MYYDGPGGLLLTAGARSGKLTTILAYNLCPGVYQGSLIVLDMKGELAAISQYRGSDGKPCWYWNPSGLHGLPQHRINPCAHLTLDNPNLVADVKVFFENLIPSSGAAAGKYFEDRAREIAEALALCLIELRGGLTLPDFHHILILLVLGDERWLDFAFEMSESQFPHVVRTEAEIAGYRQDAGGGGYKGILGELLKSFACLSDPTLMASVSPPFDMSLEDLCRSDQAQHVYLMPPAEYVEAWAPVLKALFVSAMAFKSRAPAASRQTWILDECAQLGAFPLVVKLFSYGAGIGIRPWAVFQSSAQMDLIGRNAGEIITSSAALKMFFAVRDLGSATKLSQSIGAQSLTYDDGHRQAAAKHERRQAFLAMLKGEDPLQALTRSAHHHQISKAKSLQKRDLIDPAEVMSLPPGKLLIRSDRLPETILADRIAYFRNPAMAGLYLPNPFHPPLDRVQIATFWGQRWRNIITEPVPPQFAHLPQYSDGYWRRVDHPQETL